MRRTIVTIVALAFGIVAYGSTALGADSATPKGEIRFVNVNVCVVAFAFKGFEPGTKGEFEVLMNGHVYRDSFEVLSTKWVRAWRLHKILGDPHPPTLVQYRILVGGVTASGTLDCDCGGGGGGGGGGNGGNGSVTSATAASAVTSQPGFAG